MLPDASTCVIVMVSLAPAAGVVVAAVILYALTGPVAGVATIYVQSDADPSLPANVGFETNALL